MSALSDIQAEVAAAKALLLSVSAALVTAAEQVAALKAAQGNEDDAAVEAAAQDLEATIAQAQATIAGASVPAAPVISLASATAGEVDITWPAVPGAASYAVYRGTSAGGEGASPIASPATPSYSDTGLTSGTTYFYTVVAVNPIGASPASAEESITSA